MKLHGISEKSYTLLKYYLRNQPEIKGILIFGSRAKGNAKNGSDIDLAVKGKNISSKDIMKWSGYINETLPIPYHVDLVGYHLLENPELKDHIDRVALKF